MSKQITWYGKSDCRALANAIVEKLPLLTISGELVSPAQLTTIVAQAIEHYMGGNAMSGDSNESMWHIVCHSCGEHWNLLTATVCPKCFAWPRRAQQDTKPVPHIDSDRRRGPSDWDRECQESGRLNRNR